MNYDHNTNVGLFKFQSGYRKLAKHPVSFISHRQPFQDMLFSLTDPVGAHLASPTTQRPRNYEVVCHKR